MVNYFGIVYDRLCLRRRLCIMHSICLFGTWPSGAPGAGPGCPFGSLVPARARCRPSAWALVSGLVTSCWRFFFGLVLGAAKQYAARKPTICDLMLFLSI